MKGHLWSSRFNTGLWVMHPSLEVSAVVGEDGGESDSSPRNLESRGKSCARQHHVIGKGAREMSEQNVLAEVWK